MNDFDESNLLEDDICERDVTREHDLAHDVHIHSFDAPIESGPQLTLDEGVMDQTDAVD